MTRKFNEERRQKPRQDAFSGCECRLLLPDLLENAHQASAKDLLDIIIREPQRHEASGNVDVLVHPLDVPIEYRLECSCTVKKQATKNKR